MIHTKKNTISNWACASYAAPVIASSWLMAPVSILQGIYAKYYGLSLVTLSLVLLITRVFDAVTDPLIGYSADNCFRRTGTYKPFVIFGGLSFIVASYCIYVPPYDVGPIYFTAWLFLFYLSWTIFEVPHLAWAGKLAETSTGKAKIYAFRNISNYSGFLLFFLIPLLPIFESNDVTPDTLKVSVSLACILMIVFLYIFRRRFNGPPLSVDSIVTEPREPLDKNNKLFSNIKKTVDCILVDRFFIGFLVAYGAISISSAMWYSVIFLYVDVYLGMGAEFAKMFLVAFLVGLFATPLWYRLSILVGKKVVWLIASSLMLISYIYTGLLTPGTTTSLDLMLLKSIQTLGFTCMGIVAPAVLSEIIDYSRLKYGHDNNAFYFATHTFMYKFWAAIATSAGLGIAGIYGFDATKSLQSESGVTGLQLVVYWFPAIFAVLSFIFILRLPISERHHSIVYRRLKRRQ